MHVTTKAPRQVRAGVAPLAARDSKSGARVQMMLTTTTRRTLGPMP